MGTLLNFVRLSNFRTTSCRVCAKRLMNAVNELFCAISLESKLSSWASHQPVSTSTTSSTSCGSSSPCSSSPWSALKRFFKTVLECRHHTTTTILDNYPHLRFRYVPLLHHCCYYVPDMLCSVWTFHFSDSKGDPVPSLIVAGEEMCCHPKVWGSQSLLGPYIRTQTNTSCSRQVSVDIGIHIHRTLSSSLPSSVPQYRH